jgi:protein SCO1/2
MHRPFRIGYAPSSAALLAALLLVFTVSPRPAAAHTAQDETLPEVGVDERLGAAVPLDAAFTDQDGKPVRLAAYFTGGPVVLTLNYYACPMLCPLIFRNFSATINAVKELSLGKDYRVVTVSINPEETVAMARAKASETYAMLRDVPAPSAGWPFLLGGTASISRLASAVGVRYTKLGKDNFAHPNIAVVLTPDGKVSRYLYGLEQRPVDFRLALIEAGGGKIGSPVMNRVLLYCYHYDPVGRRYALAAMNLVKIAGGAVLLLLALLLLSLWSREKRRGTLR